ncbi:MAG: hypothetical protein DRR08_08435 [Candidatus Parabeggiatoa sp. nov. 2]|nr:MAG: hypothetical protein B6247_16905 [Beggiatoa sp. 4572_84]RKZ61575.1 MAG: hypothetical protein DRR08_08435 [Gammaproteobacteria bacterium]HEC85133.1 hypothetical protein [Thioploca sp.]
MGWLATVKILSGGDWQENQAFSSGRCTVNREVDRDHKLRSSKLYSEGSPTDFYEQLELQ